MKFGIVFGGQSYEHEVSIISAISVKRALKQDCFFVFCDKNRKFFLIEDVNMVAPYFKDGEYKKAKELQISNGGFYVSGIFSKSRIEADVYINLIHGCDGEDGKLASMFEFFGIEYIGPRLEASVLSYNKVLTKKMAELVDVKVLKFETITRNSLPTFTYPLILKPAHLGSSLGIGIVHNEKELNYAMDIAFELDDIALIEPYVANIKEYNLAGCKIDGEMVFSNFEEPKKVDFLNFDQKYLDFSRPDKPEIPSIGQSLQDKMKEYFYKIYNAGFEGALIRCDFFVMNNEVYLNEINPCPGSLANYLFDDFNDIVERLARSLPVFRQIPVTYDFINKITVNK